MEGASLMGGINSGRRMVLFAEERNKPLAEEASILDIAALVRLRMVDNHASGIYRWGNDALSYSTHGKIITLDYQVRGQAIRVNITIGEIPLYWNNGTSRRCFLCPECGKSVYKLYIPLGHTRFCCRLCSGIAYESQTIHYGSIAYRFAALCKEERLAQGEMDRRFLF